MFTLKFLVQKDVLQREVLKLDIKESYLFFFVLMAQSLHTIYVTNTNNGTNVINLIGKIKKEIKELARFYRELFQQTIETFAVATN